MSPKELLKALPFEIERSLCYRFNLKLNRRPSSAPFLSGDTFRKISDIVADSDVSFENLKKCAGNLSSSSVIFVQSNYLSKFQTEILPLIKTKFVLISHNSDTNIDEKFLQITDSPFLLKWFAQNCTDSILNASSKVIPLPIGLENQRFHNAGNIKSFKRLQKKITEPNWKQPKVLFALNFSTNPDARFECYRAFWKKPITKELTTFISTESYRKIASKCMFIASPVGNGLDCHRTWEAMYLNAVPVVESNKMNDFFAKLGLPMLCVSDWCAFAQKTESELVQIYDETMKNCDKSALQIEFWQNRIKELKK